MQARQSDRVETNAAGSCKTARGMQWDIQIENLSKGGCRVDDPRHGLELGSFIKVLIAGTGPHDAEVAWRQGDRVGMEFLKPLPERVFKLLSTEQWSAARDEFDRRGPTLAMRRVV